MDLAAFSPQKRLTLSSLKGSARKRNLFPTKSPQTSDLGIISELRSDDSDLNSLILSPSSATTPCSRLTRLASRNYQNLRTTKSLSFNNNSPKKSPRKLLFEKENIDHNSMSVKKSSKKAVLVRTNLEEHSIRVNTKDSKQVDNQISYETDSSDNFITPKKSTVVVNNWVQRNHVSASKYDVIIRPNSFYGTLAPILAANQTNRIQGMKCVFRPLEKSKAKTKLVFEHKKGTGKRRRSRSVDAVREAKRRKPIFTGVHHAVPKPLKYSPPPKIELRRDSIRKRDQDPTNLSLCSSGAKRKEPDCWEYTMRFTKPTHYEETSNLGANRKFFKTTLSEIPRLSPDSPEGMMSPAAIKRRKLLDTRKDYLVESVPDELQISVQDIPDWMHDEDTILPEVNEILLRLEEEDVEENKKADNVFTGHIECSPTTFAAIDSLASLDLNDSFSTTLPSTKDSSVSIAC